MTTPDLNVIDRLARMDEKLNQLLHRDDDHEARIRQLEQRVDPANVEHERRITALEHWRLKLIGAVIGSGSAGGGLGALITYLIGG